MRIEGRQKGTWKWAVHLLSMRTEPENLWGVAMKMKRKETRTCCPNWIRLFLFLFFSHRLSRYDKQLIIVWWSREVGLSSGIGWGSAGRQSLMEEPPTECIFKMTLLTSDVNGLLFSHLTKNKNLRIWNEFWACGSCRTILNEGQSTHLTVRR